MPRSIEHALPQAMPLPPISRLLMAAAVTVARWEMNTRTRSLWKSLIITCCMTSA